MRRVWRSRAAALLCALALGAGLAGAPAANAGEAGAPAAEAGEADARLLVTVAPDAPALDTALPSSAVTDELYVVEVPAARAATAAAALRARRNVLDVVEDAPAEVARVDPRDPLFSVQWGLARINATGAWAVTTGDDGTLIAVLDTGVDPSHPDLADAVLPGYDFVNRRPRAIDDNDERHGTIVAGVAAARGDNGVGIAGMCWRCRVLPVKVMDHAGRGGVITIIEGIYWAADQGADIINLSLGSSENNLQGALRDQLREAVRYAQRQGAVVVAAAGNEPVEQRVYPAAFPEVVAVAASNPRDEREPWSTHGGWVEVAAPGCTPWTDDSPSGGLCGTSVSAPMVSGTLALAHATVSDSRRLRAALLQTARPVGVWVERGRIDAAATVRAAGLAASVPVAPAPPGALGRRVSGANRYATAANLARELFDPGVRRVYLTTGRSFADGLAAGAVAASTDVPVLLTEPDRLSAAAAAALRDLRPREVVVVGGAGAVSRPVLEEAGRLAGVTPRRVAGADRYTTAARLGADVFRGGAEVVYLATGEDFADALAIGPAGARLPGPVLLTERDRLPPATQAALQSLRPARVVVVGGSAAVSQAVVAEAGRLTRADVERWAGEDRYGTAAVIAREAYGAAVGTVMLASGVAFPDALASGSAARRERAPLLLVRPDEVPAATAAALDDLDPGQLLVLGGAGAVAQSVVDAAAGR